ncbi:MAG: phosphoribosylglycinamide formyltransferase [Candidatus Micrarchaeia archaeon]
MEFGIVVLASGRGSNFKAILDAIKKGKCSVHMLALVSDNADAKALTIAKKAKVPVHIIDKKNYLSNIEFDNAILAVLEKYSPQLVVLAGYMRVLRSPALFEKYKGKIINIHPALLPKYPGLNAQKQAFDSGEAVSGLTIHCVDESVDGGTIIYQQKVDISDCKSAEEVADKILMQEHIAYPSTIDRIAKGEIKLFCAL